MKLVQIDGYGYSRELSLDALLSRPLFAYLATNSEDGVRDSPVWFLWEVGAVWIIGNATDSFPRRIQEDDRCAISIVDFDCATGRVHHAGFRGTATVEPWDPERAIRLLSRYLGARQAAWDDRFKDALNDQNNRWIRFHAFTYVLRDQSYKT